MLQAVIARKEKHENYKCTLVFQSCTEAECILGYKFKNFK